MTGRFRAVGGDIIDFAQANHRVPLSEAYSKLGDWSRQAITLDQHGYGRLGNIFRRDGRVLAEAIRDVIDQRRAAGHTDLHAPDRVRKVS